MEGGLPSGTILAGRYEVRAELGRGGMGIVYEVEHIHTGERLALKVLKIAASLHEHTVARFKREARASAQIKSEHVVRVTDADAAPELGDAPFFVMELLNGTDLEAHVNTHGPLPPPLLLEVLGEIGAGLSAAHAAGIVHRDLKPENLFLHRRADGVVVAKILDFGISKFSADKTVGLTTTGAFVGTPLYMAPEQANSEHYRVTPATDIWALGLVTLRLLTGEHLWGTPSMAELITKIVAAPIPKPSERWPETASMSPALDAWFARSCDRDPAKRWSSVEDQMRSLKDALNAEPIAMADTRPSDSPSPDPPTTLAPAPRSGSHRRLRRALAALAAGALVSTTIGFQLTSGRGRATIPAAAGTREEAAAVDASILALEDLPASPAAEEPARDFRSAMRAYAAGDIDREWVLLDEAIKCDPLFASAQLQLAYYSSMAGSGLPRSGRDAFRAATEHQDALPPRDRAFLNAISPSFLDPPRFRETAARLEALLAVSPGDVQANEALGLAYAQLGDATRAERSFREALRLQPTALLENVLLAQIQGDRGQTKDAVQTLEACIERSSSSMVCRYQLVATLSSIGRCLEADSAARDAVAIAPNDLFCVVSARRPRRRHRSARRRARHAARSSSRGCRPRSRRGAARPRRR